MKTNTPCPSRTIASPFPMAQWSRVVPINTAVPKFPASIPAIARLVFPTEILKTGNACKVGFEMAEMHTVVQGECLSSIAYNYGFGDWHIIYDDSHNADFKAKRPNPNLIYPGDELYIPDVKPRDDNCQTDANHRFQLLTQPTYVNLRIQDMADKAISNAK